MHYRAAKPKEYAKWRFCTALSFLSLRRSMSRPPNSNLSAGSRTIETGPVRQRRYKAAVACTDCRRRKLKCDGVRPVCGRCSKRPELRGRCTYTITSDSTHRSPSTTHRVQTPLESHPRTDNDSARPEDHAFRGDDDQPGPFAVKVAAAIHAKIGISSRSEQCPIPLLDAPLFGSSSPTTSQSPNSTLNQANNVLPPRKQADHLLGLYWQHLDSLEPTLDQSAFHRSYQALYIGEDVERDERLFTSTLNVVFALATQLQEDVPPDQRESISLTFFSRTWGLIRPDLVLWECPSIELVQCLLLMSRFSQCTSNQHQTWMLLGVAVRVAQSLGLHQHDICTADMGFSYNWRARELWHQCAFMDRYSGLCTLFCDISSY